jgi:predicted aldo/keto reductase-like oxidoreductase
MTEVAPIGSGADYGADVRRARRFEPLLKEAGVASLVELGIRFVASHPAVSTLQVGIATVDEFEGGAQAVLKGALPAGVLARIGEMQKGFAGESR